MADVDKALAGANQRLEAAKLGPPNRLRQLPREDEATLAR